MPPRVRTHIVKVWYCPKCSRPFYDLKTNLTGLATMEDHIKTNHPNYWPMYKSGDLDAPV